MRRTIAILLAISAMPVLPVTAAETEKPEPADIDAAAYAALLKKYSYDKNSDGIITEEELSQLTYLSLDLEGITDVSWMAKLTECTQVNLKGGTVTDFSVLGDMPKLCTVEMDKVPLTDISYLKGKHLDWCRLDNMEQITDAQRAELMEFQVPEIHAGTAERFRISPTDLLATTVKIENTDIAAFETGSDTFGGTAYSSYCYVYGKQAGETKYTASVGDKIIYTGTIKVTASPEPDDLPLHDTAAGSWLNDRSCWYNPPQGNISSAPVSLINGTLYTFCGKTVKAAETDVADYDYFYLRNYEGDYNYADIVLKKDGTLLCNGEKLTDAKILDMRRGYALSELGTIEALVPQGTGFVSIPVAADADHLLADCHPLYISKSGKLNYYGFRLTGDGLISDYAYPTGINEPVCAVSSGSKCYVIDEKNTLYELDFSKNFSKKILAKDAVSIDVNGSGSTLFYTKTDGTTETVTEFYYATASGAGQWKALGVESGAFYIPEYQQRGMTENDAVIQYYIDRDRTVRFCFNGDVCSMTNIRTELCESYDTEADEGVLYFLRTDGSIVQYLLDSKKWQEIEAGTVPKISGDLNADGKLNRTDVDLLRQWLCTERQTLPDAESADLNSDGIINAADLSRLKTLYRKTS